MKTIFATALALYLLWVAGYLLVERFFHKKKKQGPSTPNKPTVKAPEDELIVKSAFSLCHSLPEASKSENQKNTLANDPTFAPSEEAKPPARVPDEALDESFLHTVEDNPPMDISVPLDYEAGSEPADDVAEEEEEEPWLQGNLMLADSSSFEEMGTAVRTVVHHQNATLPEKEHAGGVLVEIQRTDMFEQLVQSAPGRGDIVGEAMRLHLEAYRRQLAEEAETAGATSQREVPRDFDIRDFV